MSKEIEEELIARRAKRDASFFDLYSIDQLSNDDINLIYDIAPVFKKHKTAKLSLNKGCSMVHTFFESSTRTLASFDLSAKNLSMDTTNVSSGNTDKKGESFLDTAETIDAYNPKVVSIRTAQSGVAEFLSRHIKASVINAGDGWHEHPTQALLDGMTMLSHFGGNSLKGKTVTIIGDILHSRVFGSLVRLLKKLEATVRVSGPQTMLPAYVENFGVSVHYNVEEALEGADVIYTLRVQGERGANTFVPTLREYSKMYGISRKRLDIANKNAILMHPGPVQRDIDVHSALVSVDPQSHILKQVENGMAVRKSVLWLLCQRYDGLEKEFARL
ncbi:MAG: aspartate carbamoyltransferase [Micavibrio sp.]|nr:aspartate carbamoyltransferase [Micavibrio sp.]HCK32663.1 aspartate carbamoyltransferase [Rhodospirillaceae bacterium]|tara:strand:+ start:130 stop:1122 length:993 start_codon:yes stop_codon:yes gene_type:complete